MPLRTEKRRGRNQCLYEGNSWIASLEKASEHLYSEQRPTRMNVSWEARRRLAGGEQAGTRSWYAREEPPFELLRKRNPQQRGRRVRRNSVTGVPCSQLEQKRCPACGPKNGVNGCQHFYFLAYCSPASEEIKTLMKITLFTTCSLPSRPPILCSRGPTIQRPHCRTPCRRR